MKKNVIDIGIMERVITPGTEPLKSYAFFNQRGQKLRIDFLNASGQASAVIFNKAQVRELFGMIKDNYKVGQDCGCSENCGCKTKKDIDKSNIYPTNNN